MAELKSCPFCGKNPVLIESVHLKTFRVGCLTYPDCPCYKGYQSFEYNTPEKAMEMWNKRSEANVDSHKK